MLINVGFPEDKAKKKEMKEKRSFIYKRPKLREAMNTFKNYIFQIVNMCFPEEKRKRNI